MAMDIFSGMDTVSIVATKEESKEVRKRFADKLMKAYGVSRREANAFIKELDKDALK